MTRKIFEKIKAAVAPCTDLAQLDTQISLNPEAWESAVRFLSSDLEGVSLGRHELEGGAYASVSEYVSKDVNKWEYHEKFIDIQYVVKGREQIGICSRRQLLEPLGGYDDQKDLALFAGASSPEMVTMSPDGFFTVLFPDEAHCPCLKVQVNEDIKKVVVKIPYMK